MVRYTCTKGGETTGKYYVLNGLGERTMVVPVIASLREPFDCWYGDTVVWHYDENGELLGREHAYMPPDAAPVYVAKTPSA